MIIVRVGRVLADKVGNLNETAARPLPRPSRGVTAASQTCTRRQAETKEGLGRTEGRTGAQRMYVRRTPGLHAKTAAPCREAEEGTSTVTQASQRIRIRPKASQAWLADSKRSRPCPEDARRGRRPGAPELLLLHPDWRANRGEAELGPNSPTGLARQACFRLKRVRCIMNGN
ncbi:hypothetical protein C8Q79DRAFT_106944 [Trametes meyenii]|nr:hypothetical protein C8Q79DRAFT_106944 [Trametes meyenii]